MQTDTSAPRHGRAWIWTGHADPLSLELKTVDAPPLASREVLVRNAVIGLNPVDWKMLRGDHAGWRAGKIPGVDGAGIVAAVGADVEPHWLGKRVAYHTSLAKPGSFAEYTPVAARALLSVPAGVSWESAASVPCPALTACLALDKLPDRKGARLLISGAGGAVGLYALQLAVRRGFEVDVMCHPRHWARLHELGAGACFEGALDASSMWPTQNEGRYFAILDSVDGAHAARLAPAISANGHLVCVQGRVQDWPSEPFGVSLSLHEVALGALHRYGNDADWARLVAMGVDFLDLVDHSQLRIETHIVGDFESLAERLDALKHRSFSGKSLIAVRSDTP
ncbi:zinc-binding dehydrogenase [Paraburkholderia acidisoli]|uniref:Alcohol dehydrogenase catalytic domain-containing protein n=1 Tax=Paraburkholderia acidisoli TaxID=2571748 RepID=A0A7Z2JIW6_9BURK|nr:zinc-binding dehydrogenase [Paraburkholderia acidisoli]QGZ66186.1 alcohol dehydrogenase catalytic domain-containing protein [Paraburkholderia acidisoli]